MAINEGFTNRGEALNETINGKKEGKWVEYIADRYYPEYTTQETATYYYLTIYKSGEPDSMRRWYNMNGSLIEVIPFKDGKIEGVKKEYYEDGILKEEMNFVNGIINGVVKTYWHNGNLQSDGTFANGKINGAFRNYYSNGKIHSMGTCLNDIWEVTNYDEQGEELKSDARPCRLQ